MCVFSSLQGNPRCLQDVDNDDGYGDIEGCSLEDVMSTMEADATAVDDENSQPDQTTCKDNAVRLMVMVTLLV